MEISVVFQAILIIAMMIIIGAMIGKTSPLNGDTRQLFISMIINVAMPCIILSSIFNVEMDDRMIKNIAIVFCLSIVINIAGIMLGWLFAVIFHRNSNRTREIALMSGLGNTGFIGIPLCAAVIGPEGALFAAIFDAGVDFTIWTVGVIMLQKNRKFALHTLKAMINIPMAAVAIGLLTAYFRVKPPVLFIKLTDQLAALAAPLAMFYIGMLMVTLRSGNIRQTVPKLWVPIIVKLLLLPVVAMFLINFFSFKQTVIQTLLIESMMPTLTMASILFAKYSADEDLGALTTVLSIILSLLTIPLMIYLLSLFIAF